MHELIITRIINRGEVTLMELESRATERGISLSELYDALERVHRDKRVERTVRKGDIVYKVAKPKKSPLSHLTWKNENYPEMDETNNAGHPAFADLDFSWMFLPPEEIELWQLKKTKSNLQ